MRQQTTGYIRPGWAAVCLLAYLFSATPLLPISTALVAWVDGEHRVVLEVKKDGMRVVLGHDARDARTAHTHSHCVVSRALTLLAEPSGPAHSDHVLNFHSGTVGEVGQSVPCVNVPLADETPMAPPLPATPISRARIRNVEAPLLDIPPPAISVVATLATVLLI